MPGGPRRPSTDPRDLAVLLKGLYEKVARQLHLDPYYVSRVARGEHPSKLVEDALRRELKKIKARVEKGRRVRLSATRKKSAAKKRKKKQAPKNKSFRLLAFKPPRDIST